MNATKPRVRQAAFPTAITKQTRNGSGAGERRAGVLDRDRVRVPAALVRAYLDHAALDRGHAVRVGQVGDRRDDPGGRGAYLWPSRSRQRCTPGCSRPRARPRPPSSVVSHRPAAWTGARSWGRRAAGGHHPGSPSPCSFRRRDRDDPVGSPARDGWRWTLAALFASPGWRPVTAGVAWHALAPGSRRHLALPGGLGAGGVRAHRAHICEPRGRKTPTSAGTNNV